MANPAVENMAKANTEAGASSSLAAEKTFEGNASALTDSGNASRAAFQELTKAYQELATKNAENLRAAIQSLSALKTPAEFFELQKKLITEGVEAAVRDSQHIGQLTTAIFTAAFAPVKKQIETAQASARK